MGQFAAAGVMRIGGDRRKAVRFVQDSQSSQIIASLSIRWCNTIPFWSRTRSINLCAHPVQSQ